MSYPFIDLDEHFITFPELVNIKDGLYLPNNTNFFIENKNNFISELIFCEGL